METLTDEQLVAICLEGKTEAFAVLVKRYEKQVYSLAYRLCHDYDEASDLAQDAFIHIYQVLAKFSNDRKFFPWMYRIAHNVCINSLNKKKQQLLSFDESIEVKEDSNTRAHQPEVKAVADETYGSIMAAMDSLPENYRLPVILRYTENLSYQEIADILQVPVSTVETRLFRGRKLLQKKLASLMERRDEKWTVKQ